jgi:hypothetical protein
MAREERERGGKRQMRMKNETVIEAFVENNNISMKGSNV